MGLYAVDHAANHLIQIMAVATNDLIGHLIVYSEAQVVEGKPPDSSIAIMEKVI